MVYRNSNGREEPPTIIRLYPDDLGPADNLGLEAVLINRKFKPDIQCLCGLEDTLSSK